ncbi:MAG: hydroxymethylglutaryl-CoA lyase [Aliidiomarina sp.]|uniref:hydroxymethylglutaryl-CoA lyase n=1 Tax=Aliidiomarina sp. TaxID=1872439 RepID=UPI0025BA1EC1|nr:hydroxymethylglutaryl-CoA lyase [Aliidiomarina sp.]MCH8500776.1 hydroxymethylglutaryl-CoA lyase [Aliidiomarina sp.]
MRDSVIVNEVGPRDGLQSLGSVLSVADRIALIRALNDAGLRHIEAGSFVSPKAVPQMAGTDELFQQLPLTESVNYSALVPNLRGYENAKAAGAQAVNVVLSVTDTMNQKNIRMSLAETTAACAEIVKAAKADGIHAHAYLAVAFTCPFEGKVPERVVLALVEKMLKAGADKLIIADTIGAANPAEVRSLIAKVTALTSANKVSCHFHDTRGMGLANTLAALDGDIREFDSAIGGMGGCPFSPGASGNVATEDVVLMLDSMGLKTGIAPLDLVAAIDTASKLVNKQLGGRSYNWLTQQIAKQTGGEHVA